MTKRTFVVILFSILNFNSFAQQSTQVIVVGAGISGLAAAEKLTSEGIEVIVLEAQDRVGGRLRTDRSLGIPFDEGASWIHGPKGNPITELAKKSNINTFLTDDNSLEIYDKKGEKYDIQKSDRKYYDYLSALGKVEDESNAEESFEQIFRIEYPQKLEEDLWKYMLSAYLEFDVGADISKLSSGYFYDDEEFYGEDVIVTNGYDLIPNALAKGLDIRLNEKVTGIDYSGDKVKIKSSGGNFETERVIITVPLGVLKKNIISFDPPLPKKKKLAIDALEMGSVNKFMLVWDTVFWNPDIQYVGYTPEEKGKFNYLMNCSKFINANALMTFSFGDYSKTTELMSDAMITEEIMKHLKVIYGEGIPEPTSMLRTKWNNNQYTFGSYSYPGITAKSKAYDRLAKNIDKKIFFAGEHTISDYRATVHGAYLSGIREAENILKLIK